MPDLLAMIDPGTHQAEEQNALKILQGKPVIAGLRSALIIGYSNL